MKQFLLIGLFLLAFFSKAQDSSYCYNSGNISAEAAEELESAYIKQESALILMPVMNEKEVIKLLKEKNDSEINRLVKNFKPSKTFKNVGFSAIPEALFGAGLIGAAAVSNSGTIQQRGVGMGLLALGAVSLTSSLCFKFVQTKNYKKAIARYNQMNN